MRILIFSLILIFYGCVQIKEPKLKIYTDYSEGLRFAIDEKKKIFLAFDSYNNPVKSTSKLFTNDAIALKLKDYAVIHLRVDGGDLDSKMVAKFQIEKFKVNFQPCYFILNDKEQVLKGPLGYCNANKILEFITK
jgi:hypothetical protein